MTVLQHNPFLIASGNPTDPTFPVQRSVRLRSSASAYLNRTPASAGNRQTWTWSGWVKRGSLGSAMTLFAARTGVSATYSIFRFGIDTLIFEDNSITALTTAAVYRDPSSWYHIVLSMDTTQASQTNRTILYVNGTQVSWSTGSYPAQNANLQINSTQTHIIGQQASSQYFDGYLTEINFVDGQALKPIAFGGYNPGTGVWEPRKYSGTYGANGFYLPFTNPASIGADGSGNGNNWTANAIQTTNSALATYDSMLDVPTNTSGSNSSFAVLSPIARSTFVANSSNPGQGNLDIYQASISLWAEVIATIGVSSGKWYWEIITTNLSASANLMLGVVTQAEFSNLAVTTKYVGSNTAGYGYYSVNGNKYYNGAATAYGGAYVTNDVVGVALDMDAGTLTFYKNGVSQGIAFSGLTGTIFPAFSSVGAVGQVNFGQQPFKQTVPTGHKSLNLFNLPDPAITQPVSVHNLYTYTGNGGGLQVGEIQKPMSLYNLDRSLRFRASNNAYLNRTAGTATSTTTWTWSGWIKRGTLGTTQVLFSGGSAASNNACIGFTSDSLDVYNFISSVIKARKITTQVFRDPSAWNHIVIAASGSSFLNVYINGIQVTSFSTNTNPDGSAWLFQSGSIRIGADAYAVTNLFDGYLADVYFIDGQALTPDSFGQFDGNYYWTPKAYSGTYGTNGWHLEFEDFSAATAAAIGKDTSGQGNNWTPNNIVLSTWTNAALFRNVGTTTWTAPAGVTSVEYLVVGGGGGGGSDSVNGTQAGGGGGGGVLRGTLAVTPGTSYTVTVGAGGAGASPGGSGTQGGNSVFASITATGGGRGSGSGAGAGGNGGSGGGGVNGSAGGTGVAGQGSAGGTGATGGFGGGGGGGGADGAGGTINGGVGRQVTIAGVTAYYGGGGGGRNGNSPYTQGTGGLGGGGDFSGAPGTANTGGGGGGGGGPGGIAGGSGIVVLSYPGASTSSDPTNDTMVDVPTLTSADAANFCTLDPLQASSSGLRNGNLTAVWTSSSTAFKQRGTYALKTGKWYFEGSIESFVIGNAGNTNYAIGFITTSGVDTHVSFGWTTNGTSMKLGYRYDVAGAVVQNVTYNTVTPVATDIFGIEYDVDNGTANFYKNGTLMGSASGLALGEVNPHIWRTGTSNAATMHVNFGQRAFTYTPSVGYNEINAYNVAEVLGDVESPDFVWIKSRSAATDHALFNSISGVGKYVRSSNSGLEVTDVNSLIQFNKNGFLLGNSAIVNTLSATYVAAAWKMAATTVTNNGGTIPSQVRANPTAGISIVRYTGNGTGALASVGHGLLLPPEVIIVKNLSANTNWPVYHIGMGNPLYYMTLNGTAIRLSDNNYWGATLPDYSQFYILGTTGSYTNVSGNNYEAICMRSIEGFSKFGSYLSNNAAEGPFVYTGFRPRWLMVKRADAISGATGGWFMYDAARNTYNVMDKYLFAEGTAGDNTLAVFDFTANGFKIRSNNQHVNTTAGNTYVYLAFAENPFKYALAR